MFYHRSKIPNLASQHCPGEESIKQVSHVLDFIDLSEAFPKDHYPLPNIYFLIDDSSGYETMSFMDVCS